MFTCLLSEWEPWGWVSHGSCGWNVLATAGSALLPPGRLSFPSCILTVRPYRTGQDTGLPCMMLLLNQLGLNLRAAQGSRSPYSLGGCMALQPVSPAFCGGLCKFPPRAVCIQVSLSITPMAVQGVL